MAPRRCGIVLALVTAGAAALKVPIAAPASRRKAIQLAAPLLSAPLLPGAARAALDDERLGFGSVGLRSDIPESLRGDGIEILVTELKYRELDACDTKKIFVPAKGGPWSCLEVTATALWGVRMATCSEVRAAALW